MKYKKFIFTLGLMTIMTFVSGCGTKSNEVYKHTKDVFAMDTYMTLTVYGEEADHAIDEGIAEIKRLDALLSTGSESSEVSVLNTNQGGHLSEDTSYLWERSYEIYLDTRGAFDVTIYPIMKAWGFASGEFNVPKENEVASLLTLVNSSKVVYDQRLKNIELPKNVQIDFGGIAKGYTSQRVADIMKSSDSISGAMLNLGGNIQLVGKKPDGSLFKVGIKNPLDEDGYLGIIEATDVAIITSGGYERYFEEEGVKYHHIIDPCTGYPANNGLVSVTIISADGTLADGYSTSLFVMGKEKAIDYWKSNSDEFEFVLLTDSGELLVSEGLYGRFSSKKKYTFVKK